MKDYCLNKGQRKMFILKYDIVDDNIFENIAKRRNLLLSNNRYDIEKAKYLLLKEFKEGIIGKVCVERPGVDYGVFRV